MRVKNKLLINFYRNEVRQFEWKLLKKIIQKQYVKIAEALRKKNELMDKLLNLMDKEEKWPDNITPINHNHAPNTPIASGR